MADTKIIYGYNFVAPLKRHTVIPFKITLMEKPHMFLVADL